MENQYEDRNLAENLGEYINLQKQKLLLGAADTTSRIFADLIVKLFFVIFALLALMMLAIGCSLFLNSYLNSDFLGFIIIAVLFALSGLLLYRFTEEPIKKILSNEFLNIIYDENA